MLLIGLVLITRPLTVLFHELGHAISVILLTKQRATIYIGTYGDPKKCVKINFGLLTIFLRSNPFAWRLGICIPSAKSVSVKRQIIYTLTGPIASLIIATTACYFTFAYDLHGFLKLFLIIFLGSAFLDLLINLIPSKKPIKLYDGKITYNDGYSLKQLFYYIRLPKEYTQAADLYNEQKFADAAVLLEKLLSSKEDENIYRLAISSYLQEKNYHKAKEISDAFAIRGKMNSDDLSNIALSNSMLGFHDEALELYDKSLRLNPFNKYSLNNKGYTLNLMEKYKEAISLFDKSIELDTDFAYSYNNRGLAKIKLGQTEEGLQDINRSFEIDPDNSYAYMNMGIYHFDKGEVDEALQNFAKAKEIDSSTYMIDKFIKDAQKEISIRAAGNSGIAESGA
ncbi:tetratricopeptide repeat protein [Limnovirga soli]|nr:tetratricopeptide repeat protein [Limnovirga soli]